MKKGLLLGAGFSYDLGMPLVGELTEVFLNLFSTQSRESFVRILSSSNPYGNERPINEAAILEGINLLLDYKDSKGGNYEELLACVQALGKSPGKSLSDKDSYNYLFSILYEIIHNILTEYQVESYSLFYKRHSKYFSQLNNVLSEAETWVFTLNHDLYLESLAIDLGIPITYGDEDSITFPVSNLDSENKIVFSCLERGELTFHNKRYYKDCFGINMVKLHGGLSEYEYGNGKLICNQSLDYSTSEQLISDFNKIDTMAYYHEGRKIPSGKDRVITNVNGELDIISKSMLTGGRKYSETTNPKPGEEKLSIFYEAAQRLDLLTIIGYGFGDRHINDRLSNAMVVNNSLELRIVDPVNKDIPDFLKQFDYNNRVKRAVCGAAPWLSYSASEKWDYDMINRLKDSSDLREELQTRVYLKFRRKFNVSC